MSRLSSSRVYIGDQCCDLWSAFLTFVLSGYWSLYLEPQTRGELDNNTSSRSDIWKSRWGRLDVSATWIWQLVVLLSPLENSRPKIDTIVRSLLLSDCGIIPAVVPTFLNATSSNSRSNQRLPWATFLRKSDECFPCRFVRASVRIYVVADIWLLTLVDTLRSSLFSVVQMSEII